MKRFRLLALSAALMASTGAASAQCSAGSTLIVGPSDQYAFQWCNGTSVTQIGLNFASSANEYQFKRLDGSNIMTINPTGANYLRMGAPDAGNYANIGGDGDLSFVGNADYLVGSNRYAFRSSADQDNGLFFNVSLNQYEFRSNTASAGLAIKANTAGSDIAGDLVGSGGATFARGVVVNGPGSQPAAVKGSGSFPPTNGYLGAQGTADFDGVTGFNITGLEIGVLGLSTGTTTTDNHGLYGYSNGIGATALHSSSGNRADLATATRAGLFTGDIEVTGNIIGNLSQPNISGQATVSGPTNTQTSPGALKIQSFSPTGISLGLDNNEIQIYNGLDSAAGTLFLNFWGGSIDMISQPFNPTGTVSMGSGNLFVQNSTRRVGVGTTTPTAKLSVINTVAERSLNVLYNGISGTTQVANIESSADLSSGNDLLQMVMPSTSSSSAAFIEAEYGSGSIRFQVNANGHTGIGKAASTTNALEVCGTIRATEVIVETGWCDFVFEDDYRLAPLSEVESFIKSNKHLPGIPPAVEVESQGVKVAEMSRNFILKIEELTLYTIEQEKQITNLQAQIEELKALVSGKQ